MGIKLRSKLMLLFMSLAMVLAVPALALAAELLSAEVQGAPNRVTVEQGKNANFDIQLSASEKLNNAITEKNAAKAEVKTSYSVAKSASGSVVVGSGSDYSAPVNFWSKGDENNNSSATWAGAPTPYKVGASVSVASDVPIGTYTIALSPNNNTTRITNPDVSGAKLEDKTATTLTFEVVAPPPPSDTTAPVITPHVQGVSGDNEWYTSDVGLSWSVVDNESTISSKNGCDNVSIISDQNERTYTCSATSAGGTTTKSVTIKRDATAPVISGADVNNTTWRNSDLSQGFTASDAMSGLANSADGSFSLTASAESGSASTPTTVSKEVKDDAGNSATRTLSALIDKTAPVISGQDINETTWRNTNLSANFTASDNGGSGLANSAADSSFLLTAAGESPNANTPVSDSRTVADVAGNSATRTISAFIDKTTPSINDDGPTPATPNGENGWYINAVTNQFTASDALSGLANDPVITKSSGANEGSAVKINSGVISDRAGNTNSKDSAAFKIDLSNPSVPQFQGIQAQTYPVANLPARDAIDCSATDSLSSPVCSVTGYSNAFGSHTLTATATDQAGRQSTNRLTYTVGLKAGEVLSPINSPNKANPLATNLDAFKIKSTVPVKFRLFNDAAMTQLMTNPPAGSVAKLTFFKQDNTIDTVDLTTSLAGTANTDNIFRWNATDSQYIYNLGTSGRTAGTYGVQLTLVDSNNTQLAQSAKYYFVLRS